MFEILNVLAELINKQGFLIVFGVIALYFILAYGNILIESERKKKKLIDLDLRKHLVFSTIQRMISVDIDNCGLNDMGDGYDNKRRMARVYFKLYLFSIYKGLKKIANNFKGKEDDNDIMNFFNQLISVSNIETKRQSKQSNIADIFIEKFDYWNKERNDLILMNIKTISNSDIYEPNVKVNIIFDNYIKELYGIIFDIKNTIREINGQLKGYDFDYIEVENDFIFE